MTMPGNSDSYMRRAIELSLRGYPAPNPRVGCVIVKENEIIGEGWHEYAGCDHAEIMALREAGENAIDATVFCTLEPCNHQGRTPPCTQALIKAQVETVNFAVNDPNPVASGGGSALSTAGIKVASGLLEKEAAVANELFLTAKKRNRPVVVCKSAQSADGFIAKVDGTSKWITGEEARREGHKLRAELGCVLVGRSTVEQDDPALTARFDGVKNQPLRVVLDPHAKLSINAKVFDDENVVRFVAPGFAKTDFDVESACNEGGFDLNMILNKLFQRGMIGVLVEGGGETIASFLRAGLADKVEMFISPETFGEGRHWLGSNPPSIELKETTRQTLGKDEWRRYFVTPGTNCALKGQTK